MPKIFLKPKSPEFDSGHIDIETRECDMPGCPYHGEHRAPKDRALSDYYLFCTEHAREYNSAWDYFAGMTEKEIEEQILRSLYGERPTWRYDLNAAAEDILKGKAWDMYNFSSAGEREREQKQRVFGEERHSAEFQALAIMGLEPPVTLDAIKLKYKELAKKHHPDLNRGCKKSEELLKNVNMAYTILKVAYEQFEKLPETNMSK